jgi:hypothetical protein
VLAEVSRTTLRDASFARIAQQRRSESGSTQSPKSSSGSIGRALAFNWWGLDSASRENARFLLTEQAQFAFAGYEHAHPRLCEITFLTLAATEYLPWAPGVRFDERSDGKFNQGTSGAISGNLLIRLRSHAADSNHAHCSWSGKWFATIRHVGTSVCYCIQALRATFPRKRSGTIRCVATP